MPKVPDTHFYGMAQGVGHLVTATTSLIILGLVLALAAVVVPLAVRRHNASPHA